MACTFIDRCPELEDSDSIQFLNLSISSYGAATPTLQALANSNHLEEAWLTTGEGNEGVGLLCKEVLLPNTSLQRLRLDLKECSDEGIREVAHVMRSSRNLRQLSLLLNNVGEEGAGHISQALMESCLEEFSIYATQLDLHDKCIGDGGVAALCKALEKNMSLTTLSIAQSGVTRVGVASLTTALATGNSNVTSLDLHANHIDSEGVALLAHYLASASCVLKTLILDGNHSMGNNGATSLAECLSSNTTLEVLSVQSCGIEGKGAERFASTLSQNHTLKELRFRGNIRLGDNAVELLTRGLKVNTTLQALDLSSCGVGDEGCAHLAEALLHNHILHTLQLHKNDIGDGGITALSETLKQSYLTCLVLTENRFGSKGTAALLHSLQHNTSLTTLTLDTPTVGGAKTMSVVGILVAKNKQLQHYRKLAADLKRKNTELTTQLEKMKSQL